MPSFRFPPAHRLKKNTGFRRVFARKRSASDEWLIIYGCENELPHLRLGMAVSRKFGHAPHRNRIRRIYREAFRLTQAELPGGMDLVMIPRQKAAPTLAQVKASLKKLVPQLAARLQRDAKRQANHDQPTD